MGAKRVLVVFALAFVPRAMVALLPVVPVSDCAVYHQAALTLVDEGRLVFDEGTRAYRMPGYPALLAAVYAVFGRSPLCGRVLNALAGAFAVVLVWLLGKELGRPKAGFVAALLLALYPEHILFTNALVGESVFSALLLWWLVCVVGDFTFPRAVASGVIVGAMSYVRSVALPLALVPAVWDRRRFGRYFLAFVVAAAMLSPWAIRNYRLLGKPVLATNFWTNLWIGNGASADGGYQFDPPQGMPSGELEREAFFRKRLFYDLAQAPWRPFVLLPAKAAHFILPAFTAPVWGLAGVVYKGDPPRITSLPRRLLGGELEYLPLFLLGAALSLLNLAALGAFVVAAARRRIPKPLWVVPLYFLVVALVFFGNDRFRFPSLPIILLGATLGFTKEGR